MPKYIEKQTDGSYKVLTEKEYLDQRAVGGFLIFIALILFGIYTVGKNLLNFAALKDFGGSLYVSNLLHFHGGDQCHFVQGYPFGIDAPDSNGFLVFTDPVEIDSAPSNAIEEYVLTQYESQDVSAIEFPLIAKSRGYVSRDYDWQTDVSKGTRSLDWGAVTIKVDGKEIHGYIPYDLQDKQSYDIDENLKDYELGSDFINHYQIDGKKLRGNRFAGKFDESCSFRVVELE